jgi:hypothetical protein
MSNEHTPAETLRVRGPVDLIHAVPYLLGFHPVRSLVVVGLAEHRVRVTVRLDLPEPTNPTPWSEARDEVLGATLAETLAAMSRGGARSFVGLLFDDRAPAPTARPDGRSPAASLPWAELVAALATEIDRWPGAGLADVLLVGTGRWWSYLCADPRCCPPEGRDLSADRSTVPAQATYAGLVAHRDREALAALVEPGPALDRARLRPLVAAAAAALADGDADRVRRAHRSVKRSLFAAARASSRPGWSGAEICDDDRAGWGAGLQILGIRDSLWLAVDDGRLDGAALWSDLARRLPAPYDATACFLAGWAAWRQGDGALARIAAERAVASDPRCTAADLLLAALSQGVDPHRLPRLRLPRLSRSA